MLRSARTRTSKSPPLATLTGPFSKSGTLKRVRRGQSSSVRDKVRRAQTPIAAGAATAKAAAAQPRTSAASRLRRSGAKLNRRANSTPSIRRPASRHVQASMSWSHASCSRPRGARTTAVSRQSPSCGNRRSRSIAMLLSLKRTNARRPIQRTKTTVRPIAAAATTAPRTPLGGSKSQSAARLTQNAAPSQATAAANPSIQTYWRMRRRSPSRAARIAGANRSSSWAVRGSIAATPVSPIVGSTIPSTTGRKSPSAASGARSLPTAGRTPPSCARSSCDP